MVERKIRHVSAAASTAAMMLFFNLEAKKTPPGFFW